MFFSGAKTKNFDLFTRPYLAKPTESEKILYYNCGIRYCSSQNLR
jgi:hypothetical protein